MSVIINRVILDETGRERYLRLLEEPIDKQRFLFRTGKINYNINTVSLAEFDDKICFSDITYRIYFNSKLYTRESNKKGFTYDKKTKKIKVWFGGSIQNFLNSEDIIKFLEYFGLNWLTNERYLLHIVRKTSFEKILSGKISNPIDLCSHYLRTSLKSKSSPKLFYKCLRLFKERDVTSFLFKVGSYFKVCDNHNGVLNNFIMNKPEFPHISDMIYQCTALDKKINCNWSMKRFDLEHTKLSNIMINYELEYVGDTIIKYDGELPLLDNCEILDTEKQIFSEGFLQKHCVYSNYFRRIANKHYFAIRMYEPERCTIGIRPNFLYDANNKENKYDIAVLDQVYGYRNNMVSDNTKLLINCWLELPEVQEYFKLNFNSENKPKKVTQVGIVDINLENVAWF